MTGDPLGVGAPRIGVPYVAAVPSSAQSVRGFLDESYSGFTMPNQDLHGELAHDGPANDRTDTALKARADAHSQADALSWLLDGQPNPEPQASQKKTVEPPKEVQQGAGSAIQMAVQSWAEQPRQAVGGMRDAVQSMLDFAEWAGGKAEATLPLGGVQIFDEQGNFAPQYMSPQVLAQGRKAGTIKNPEMPDVGQPVTAAGRVVRAVTQMVKPYV